MKLGKEQSVQQHKLNYILAFLKIYSAPDCFKLNLSKYSVGHSCSSFNFKRYNFMLIVCMQHFMNTLWEGYRTLVRLQQWQEQHVAHSCYQCVWSLGDEIGVTNFDKAARENCPALLWSPAAPGVFYMYGQKQRDWTCFFVCFVFCAHSKD